MRLQTVSFRRLTFELAPLRGRANFDLEELPEKYASAARVQRFGRPVGVHRNDNSNA